MFKVFFKNFFSPKSNKLIIKESFITLKKYWIVSLITVILTTVSIFFFDKKITEIVISEKGSIALLFSKIGYYLGQMHYPLLASIFFGAVFYFRKLKDKALLMIIAIHAMLLSGIFVQFPKYLFGRRRPMYGYDELSWFNNYHLFGGKFFSYKNMSMASGDTITIAATCMVLALYAKNRVLKAFFILIPTITMFTRVHMSKHWLSDTVMGLFFGFIIGKAVYDFYKKSEITLA